jgi:hypothetical protein
MKKQPDVDISNLVPQADVSRILGISRAGVSWLIKNKKLKTTELFERTFLYRDEVEAYKLKRKASKAKKGGAKKK